MLLSHCCIIFCLIRQILLFVPDFISGLVPLANYSSFHFYNLSVTELNTKSKQKSQDKINLGVFSIYHASPHYGILSGTQFLFFVLYALNASAKSVEAASLA